MKELSIEEKAKRYDKAIRKANIILGCCGSTTEHTIYDIFPELKESEDEESKKWILEYLYDGMRKSNEQFKRQFKTAITWLEKQKVTDEEIIFRPVVGTDIRIAAKQALEKIDIGKKVVLAFNGAYIPVNGKTVGEIDSEYDAWLEKQSKQQY